jgi:hypothetical protein
MFEDYKKLILSAYRKKVEQQLLPISLVLPSPAKLRDECWKVCENRFQPKDLNTLRDFFGGVNGKEDCLRVIKRFELDKFKPLINYLKGETDDPNEKNIELLAWLIDFQPRPYELGRKYGRGEDGGKEVRPMKIPAKVQQLASTAQLELVGYAPRKNPGLLKWLIPGAIAVVSATGFSIMQFRDKPPAVQTIVDTATSCMYWTGEQYKAVPCNTRPVNATVIGLDTFQLKNFKKVMQIDTITLRSAGKLWYLKRNNFPEIFTAPGNHPEQLNKQLKPLSAYMIKKYILKNDK